MEEEEASAALVLNGEMTEVMKGETVVTTTTTTTTLTSIVETNGEEEKESVETTGEMEEEEEEEEGSEPETERGEEEDEEEVVEGKGKNLLGQWESEAASDAKPPLPDPTFNRRCSLIVSEVKYKEDFEKMKGQSLFVPGAELIHSKTSALLYLSLSIRRTGRRRLRCLSTPSCQRLRRLNVPERLQSCRVRLNTKEM